MQAFPDNIYYSNSTQETVEKYVTHFKAYKLQNYRLKLIQDHQDRRILSNIYNGTFYENSWRLVISDG